MGEAGNRKKGRGATVTFVQVHGTGTQQIVRIMPEADDRYRAPQTHATRRDKWIKIAARLEVSE